MTVIFPPGTVVTPSVVLVLRVDGRIQGHTCGRQRGHLSRAISAAAP
jgi:hypothetical protein